MSGVNKAIILGNLGRDPETRYTNDGKPVTSFSLATSSKSGDREFTEWHNVVCFGRLAEIAGEYLRKGSKAYVEGSLRTSSWEKDGQKHYKTEIIAQSLQLLSPAGNNPESVEDRQSSAADYRAAKDGTLKREEAFNDDIPFMTYERGYLA